MINGTFKIEKVWKLIAQILFYSTTILLILSAIGYQYSYKQILHDMQGGIIWGIQTSFITSYLLVYILSSVINKTLKTITKKEFILLVTVLLFYFSILSTFSINTWNYFGWAFTCYCFGAFLKMYGNDYKIYKQKYPNVLFAVGCLLLIWVSMIMFDYSPIPKLKGKWSFLMSDANKLPVFLMAVFIFVFFKNLKVRHNKIINTVAASCFGVLLIHTNSDTMRQWLWKDFLHNTDRFTSSYLWLHMLLSCIGIYIACTIIDICRIKFLEKPIFNLIGNKKAKESGN